MTIRNCINNAFDQNVIGLEEKQRLEKRLDDLIKSVPSTKEAKERLAQELEAEAAEKERRALKTEVRRKALVASIMSHRNRRGQQDIAEGLRIYVEKLDGIRSAVLGSLMEDMDKVMETFKKGAFTGDRRRQGGLVGNDTVIANLEKMVLELHGVKTGDKLAEGLANAARTAMDNARGLFNEAGGNIAKLDHYGLPHFHNPEALFNYTKPKWVEYMMKDGVLDRERTVSALTGHKLTDPEMKEALEVMWDRVTSDGHVDADPSMLPTGKGAIYKQHQDHRFLHFKPEAWFEYNKNFGSGDAYSALVTHLERMARDIAVMNHLGPNPVQLMNYGRELVTNHVMSARTIEANRIEQVAELDRLTKQRHSLMEKSRISVSDQIKQTIANLHKELRLNLQELDAIRRKGGRLSRDDAAIERMATLHTEIVRIEGELSAARNDPFYNLSDPLPITETAEMMALNERYRILLDEVRLEPSELTQALRYKAKRTIGMADAIFDTYMGVNNVPHDTRLSTIATNLRNFNVFSKLGGASITAIADLNTQKLARSFIGMDKSGFKDIVSGAVSMMSDEGRAKAVRSWITVDSALNTLNQQARFAGTLNTTMWSGYIADRTMAASGLSAMTQAQKLSFGMDFFGMMADHAKTAYDALPTDIRRMMRRNQFTAADWDAARAAEITLPEPGASGWLRPPDVEKVAGRDVAIRYTAMMYQERSYAIIEPTLRARTIMTFGTQRGTIPGEFVRSAMQFKSFGATILLLHGARVLDEAVAGRWRNVAAYGAGVLITGTLLGAAVIQLKDIVYGRDPRPMDNPAFWGQALLQSGGFGIYGDFIQNTGNRFGGGLASTLAGPSAGEIEKLMNLTVGNLKELAQGKTTNAGSELSRFIGGALPSTFYTRKIADAFLFDNLARVLDPKADEGFRRRIDTRAKDYNGQRMWWETGQSSPRRAPDLSRVVGSQ